MAEQYNVNELEPSNAKAFDAHVFEGKRIKIERVEVIDAFTSYNINGEFEEGLQRPCKKLKVITEKVTEIETAEGLKPINVSALFSLKEDKQKDGSVKLTWSTNEKGGLFKFLRKMRKNAPAELVGEFVTITCTPGKGSKSDRDFLTFATE